HMGAPFCRVSSFYYTKKATPCGALEISIKEAWVRFESMLD
ncbi:hypothetical protein OKW22_001338, partial [Bacilli bacterium PM5-3]|nr:hypothetical protein [Bacilli bacterium PM5-3]